MSINDSAYRALIEAQTGLSSASTTITNQNSTKERDLKDAIDGDRRKGVCIQSCDKSLTEQWNELVLKVTIN